MSLMAAQSVPLLDHRQLKDSNMSMERALRSITSPRKSPKSTVQKKSRQSVDKTNEESVKVAIRIRPIGSNSSGESTTRAFRANKNSVVESTESKANTTSARRASTGNAEHRYDNVFGEEIDTCTIYNELVENIVSSVSNDGINGTVFTYGQTSSGKTYTMQGADNKGIIQYAAKDIFESISKEKGANSSESVVKVSYVEIYNEELRDLLASDTKRKSNPSSLIIREDKKGSITVENLKEVAVRSLDQLMELFSIGERNKAMASTKMNDRSSRSHAILKITIEKKTMIYAAADRGDDKENNESSSPKNTERIVVKTSSTLNLVDLAGSESVRLTGATGMQKKEGGMINQSLLTLSKVLMSLGQKNPGHVNYRDSKLTRILKPSLSGNARMAVICCISPSDEYIDETRSTLQFATRAKLVKTNAVSNEVVESNADIIAKLKFDLERSMMANERLEKRIFNLQNETSCSVATSVSEGEDLKKELANLKRFLFDESQTCEEKRPLYHSKYFTDQDIILSTKEFRRESASKDDSCLPQNGYGDELLRIELANKVKEIQKLKEELTGSKPAKKQDYSPSSLSAYEDIENYKSQNVELEGKLANANSLISSLGKQIDELSSHKNDALDWIEELFAKSELKDKQISQANKERDDALAKCKSIALEVTKTKQLLEFTIGEKEDADARLKAIRSEVDALKYCVNSTNSVDDETSLLKKEIVNLKSDIVDVKSERDELVLQNNELRHKSIQSEYKIIELEHNLNMIQSSQDVSNSESLQTNKLNDLNEELQTKVIELKSQVQAQKEALSVYEEEKMVFVQRVESAENELSAIRLELEAKREEIDDMAYSLERERKNKNRQGTASEISCMDKDEVDLLVQRLEEAEKELYRSQSALTTKSQALDNTVSTHEKEKEQLVEQIKALRAASSCANQELQKENSALKSEVSTLKRQAMSHNKESDESRLLRMQLKTTKQSMAESDSELSRQKGAAKRAIHESNELRDKFEIMQKRAMDAEEANAALTKRDTELRESVSRVKELVDSLASENALLKKKNDSYKRELSDRETRGRELENLYRSAMNERDSALQEAKESKTKLHRLNESTEMMRGQFETLNEEKDKADRERINMSNRLDKMAANFEADYETLRHRLDDAIREKTELAQEFIMLEASKASIEHNADRILERDNALSGQHYKVVAELKIATKDLAERQYELNQLTRRFDFLKTENERLANENNALRDASKFIIQDKQPHLIVKKRKIFEFMPGDL